jgi:protein-S-isoprenylcysteine O-methyltransferase Ste14
MHPGLIIALLWLAFTAYWLVSAFGTKKSVPGSRRRGSGIRILFIVAFWVVLHNPAVMRYVGYHPLSFDPVLRIAGVLICAGGMAFAFWARVHLGRNWGVPMSMREGHELVTTGPYRLVRHPIYSGILLACFGSGMAADIRWFIAFPFFLAYFAYSARVEEAAMMREFPDQYAEYRRKTRGSILPF